MWKKNIHSTRAEKWSTPHDWTSCRTTVIMSSKWFSVWVSVSVSEKDPLVFASVHWGLLAALLRLGWVWTLAVLFLLQICCCAQGSLSCCLIWLNQASAGGQTTASHLALEYFYIQRSAKTPAFTEVLTPEDNELIKCIWTLAPGCYLINKEAVIVFLEMCRVLWKLFHMTAEV